ncbi:MAG: alpha-galactosidase [Bacteroidales bacterium]
MKNIFLSLICFLFFSTTVRAWDGDVLISTPNMSVVLSAAPGEQLRFSYFGDKIQHEQIQQLYDARSMFYRPAYPVFGTSSYEITALQAVHADGNQTLDMVVDQVEQIPGDEAQLSIITMKDRVYPFTVKMFYKAFNKIDMLETWVEISHKEKKAVVLKRFDSGHFLIRRGDVWVSSLHGHWGAETQIESEPLVSGMKVIKNMDGNRNGLGDHSEVMFSLDGKPQENTGRVIGAALCWAGRTKIRIDMDDTYGRNIHSIFAGMNEEVSEYKLEPKETFKTPVLALSYSTEGVGGVSRNFHRWARAGKVYGCDKPRDILLNSWEGVYMGVREDEMENMMKDIAYMGGELFVMDDGWFGDKYKRDTDHTSLGDWVVDTQKLPNGIKGLTDTAKKYGIKFGIWIEPEFVNTKSELFEKHPDWILQAKNRPHWGGRGGNQVALDLCNPKVQDFVFGVVDNLLTEHPEVAYIKWDANTEILNYGSTYLPADKQSHIYIDYHRGLENVLGRIRNKYPNVVMQACGSGGGRVSYGVMPYYDEFWVSDNTDALQRLFIQWGTSYFYPSIAMAQHVSAAKNHQTGRVLPLKFRFDVAMTGRLGMEIQPKHMSDEEKTFSQNAIADYKTIRPIVQTGNQYRLVSPYDKKGMASLMYVSEDKNSAVFFAFKMEQFVNQILPRVRMAGLDPEKKYRIKELNKATDTGYCPQHDRVFTGDLLMNTGIELQLDREYASMVLELTQVD